MLFDRMSVSFRAGLLAGLLALLVTSLATRAWTASEEEAPEEPSLRIGGALGFGMTVRKQAARFAWDWESTQEDTTVAELKMEARPVQGVAAFVRFGARLDALRREDAARFEVSEASLRLSRRVRQDSLGLRVFLGQPAVLWLDHGLGAPLDPRWVGDAAQGFRAGLVDPHGILALLGADRRGWRRSDGGPSDQVFVVRARADPHTSARLRLGGTYMRQIPLARGGPEAAAAGVRSRDFLGLDLRALAAGVQAQLDYSVVSSQFEGGAAAEAVAEPGLRRSWSHGGNRLTDWMPSNAALRAELRAPRLGSPTWGWLGFAPAYVAIGAHHTNPAAWPVGAWGSAMRGAEGYRLEAWYEAAAWPLWLRHAYDRQVQFRDASRRIILQETEIEALLSQDVRASARYVQRQVRDETTHRDDFDDDLVAQLQATHGEARFRAQWALVAPNGNGRRDAFALETALRMSSRVQFLGRVTWARDAVSVRRTFFVELQYWHLPVFETALQVGPEWVGDTADPSLDPDLVGAADQRDLVRLHFRGWF